MTDEEHRIVVSRFGTGRSVTDRAPAAARGGEVAGLTPAKCLLDRADACSFLGGFENEPTQGEQRRPDAVWVRRECARHLGYHLFIRFHGRAA